MYRGFVRKVVVPWSEVKTVKVSPLTLRWSPIQPAGASTIWIERHDAPAIQTWVNDKGADFLGRRRAFEKAFENIHKEVARHLAG